MTQIKLKMVQSDRERACEHKVCPTWRVTLRYEVGATEHHRDEMMSDRLFFNTLNFS